MGDKRQNLVIDKADTGDLGRIREFYRSRNYNQNIDSECNVIVAQIDKEIIGVARICNENEVLILRGMQIKPEFQRQGIGTKILDKVKNLLEDKECFSIPYEHLEEFYGQIGFRRIDDKEAPAFLQNRIIEYQQKHSDKRFIMIRKSV